MPDSTNNPQPATENNDELIREILEMMTVSTMKDDERTMWTVMLPSLLKPELEKFKAVLEQELSQLAEVYLQARQNKTPPNAAS